ncbi:hypothetical protein NIES22_46860 [Calothrix brevissima NIES-22]|nr:hypothetical protein NIES22_46860 [Calothrix brevissima NIES-22]
MAKIKGTSLNDILNGGTGNDSIYGYQGNDVLNGGSGNDTLDGGTGDDTMSGGVGNDTYIVDSSSDIVSEDNGLGGDAGGSKDTVKSSVNWALGNYIENLTLTETAYSGIGNTLNNKITGNESYNFILGRNGNDTLEGLLGNDTLYGGQGNDKLYGGDGNDYLFGEQGKNSLYGGRGDDRLYVDYATESNLLDGGSGNDNLHAEVSSSNNTLKGRSGDDVFWIRNSLGNNYLSGDSGSDVFYLQESIGNNTLSGGTGNDYFAAYGVNGANKFYGGDGNDSFSIAAKYLDNPASLVTQSVDGGSGNDLLDVDYSDADAGITMNWNANFTEGTITAGNNQIRYKNIESLNIAGTVYDDNIQAGNGDDSIFGGYGGNDTINGGAGKDWLFANYYDAKNGITMTLDTTTNQGSIQNNSNSVSFLNIENFQITATKYDDFIQGGNGDDIFQNNISGNDTLIGAGGNDLLITYSEGNNILDGGEGNDSLSVFGLRGNNTVNGGDGNDSIACRSGGMLNGGRGDDTFSYFDSASEIPSAVVSITIDGGTGQDYLEVNYGYAKSGITMTWDAIANQGTITNSNSIVNFLNIERLNLNGTKYDDTLLGGNGDDILVGGTSVDDDDSILDDYGNDILIGGNGNDSLTGTGGDDTFVFNNYNEGIDTIFLFNPNNDLIQVSANGFGGGLSPSVLLFSQFAIGTAASQESQRFIYDNNTGALYFDQDGNATGFTQVQFAQLSQELSLSANNFLVV